MKITKDLLKEKFKEYNKLYFDDKLPRCDIRTSSAYRYYGLFSCKYHEKYKKATFKTITISDLFDYTDDNLKDVLIHEMIHLFLVEKKKLFNDSMKHGPEFQKMAKEFNEKYNLNIRVKRDWGEIMLLPTSSNVLFTLLNIF